MVLTRRRVLLVSCAFAAVAAMAAGSGCADTDPKYGPPEAIRGRQIDFGIDGGTTVTPTEGGGNQTPRQLFTPLRASILLTCTPCHQAGGAGVTFFVGATEDESYATFKAHNYQDLTIPQPKGFFTKGAHTGPALTADQKTLTTNWSKAELAAGGTPEAGAPTDAGGGG